MKISIAKSKCMVVSKEPRRCKLEIQRKIIEQTMNFNYLGSGLSSNGILHTEVRKQVNKAARIAGSLNDMIWRNKYLRTETKVRIYKSVVRPVLTYTSETRADSSKTKQMLESQEMNTLRRIIGKTRLDRVRNEYAREQCEIQPINDWVIRRRQEWNDHVSRMDANRIAKITRDNIPTGRRSPGRPRKRWSGSLPNRLEA